MYGASVLKVKSGCRESILKFRGHDNLQCQIADWTFPSSDINYETEENDQQVLFIYSDNLIRYKALSFFERFKNDLSVIGAPEQATEDPDVIGETTGLELNVSAWAAVTEGPDEVLVTSAESVTSNADFRNLELLTIADDDIASRNVILGASRGSGGVDQARECEDITFLFKEPTLVGAFMASPADERIARPGDALVEVQVAASGLVDDVVSTRLGKRHCWG